MGLRRCLALLIAYASTLLLLGVFTDTPDGLRGFFVGVYCAFANMFANEWFNDKANNQ